MPFKDPIQRKAYAADYGHRWYCKNRTLTLARTKARKKRLRMESPETLREYNEDYYEKHKEHLQMYGRERYRRMHPGSKHYEHRPYTPPNSKIMASITIPITPIVPRQPVRRPDESEDKYIKRLASWKSSRYYQLHRREILSKYHAKCLEQNRLTAPDTLVSTDNYISPRLESLIAIFGEADARWAENICLQICSGIATKISLPKEEDREKFWNLLKTKVINRIGMHCFEQPTGGKYRSIF